MPPSGCQEETSVHSSHIRSLQKFHEADIAVINARAELEKVETDIAARLAKVQAELNKLRVRAQAKVDKAVADAEKARADVRARENHREVSKRYSEQMTDWVRDKRKEVEVLRGWMAVDNVGFFFIRLPVELVNVKAFLERTRSQVKRVEGCSRHKLNPLFCSCGSLLWYIFPVVSSPVILCLV